MCAFDMQAEYLLIPIIGVVMGVSNLVGYFKCSKDAKNQVKQMGANLMGSAVQSRINVSTTRF